MDDPRGDRAFSELQKSIARAVRSFEEQHRWRVDDILVGREPGSKRGLTVTAQVSSEEDSTIPQTDLGGLELAVGQAIHLFEDEADPWWVGGFKIGAEGFIPRVTKEAQGGTIRVWWSGAWERVG